MAGKKREPGGNSFWNLRKWTESINEEFCHSFIQNSNIQKHLHLYRLFMLFINRGDAGVASHSAGRNARNDGPGTVQVPYHYGRAQRYHRPFVTLLTQPAIQTWRTQPKLCVLEKKVSLVR